METVLEAELEVLSDYISGGSNTMLLDYILGQVWHTT